MTPQDYADEWLMANAEAVLSRVFGPLGIAPLARRVSPPGQAEWWECQPELTFSAAGLMLHVTQWHLPPNSPDPTFEPWPMFQYHKALHAYQAHRARTNHHHAALPPYLQGA